MRGNARYGLVLVAIAAAWLAGVAVGKAAKDVEPGLWEDRSPEDAARALLDKALVQAEDGSWERIAVGRVHYLAGNTERGQAIFDEYLGGRGEPSDRLRIARVYIEAGEWDKAEPLLERVVADAPKDADWLAEAGAYYNLNGERDKAEALFRRSFERESSSLWNTLRAAASYSGVAP